MSGRRAAFAVLAIIALAAAGAAAQVVAVPELVGPHPFSETPEAEPIAGWEATDQRQMRAYPEQPPTIPHSIEGYQLSVNANRCLTCHRREFTEASGAPMISVTHFMNRDGQMLADVSPRRYFCTACHVGQADVRPLVDNVFRDMSDLGVGTLGRE